MERVTTSKSTDTKTASQPSGMRKTAEVNPASSPIEQILNLHKTIGNQAVQGLYKAGRLQAALKIGQPNDVYEQEADRVADQVMRMSEQSVQKKCTSCADGEELNIQRKPESTASSDSSVSHNFISSLGTGQPLDWATRTYFEPRFGMDFSHVRVYSGLQESEAASSINALAYTLGSDVVFGAGQYRPNTVQGKRLLAHELTHVVQQGEKKNALLRFVTCEAADQCPHRISREIKWAKRMPDSVVPQQNLAASGLQRTCDPAAMVGRTAPVFFPHEGDIMDVFNGVRTLRRWTTRRVAVGLIQQALVDLGYNLGPYGPRRDGVDRIFGPVTEQAVRSFQTSESVAGASAGVIDGPTLRCIDEVRSKQVVPAHQLGTVPPSQYQIEDQIRGGRDEDIFFERGRSTLDQDDKAKIRRLAISQRGCQLDLHGFISEDELVDFGPWAGL